MEMDDVVRKIKNKREKIFKMLNDDKKSLTDYQFIMNEFKKGKISTNKNFQEVYKSFYVMDAAGLTQAFFDKYFQLLESREEDVEKILQTLSKIQRRNGCHTVQLSFASKLIHTVNPYMPIYDKNVANVLRIEVKSNVDISERIKDRVRAYELLKKKTAKLLENGEIQEIISDFKKRLN